MVPLGVVSIYFIIIQPIVIGTYCTLCLIAAVAMLIMIPFAVDELVAMGQFLRHSRRAGKPFWRTFFQGGSMPGATQSERPGLGSDLRRQAEHMAWGITVPWTLVASSLLGIWLMFTRLVLGTEGAMADSDHLVGALIVTVAIIAMAEVTRPLRFVNVAFGLWLIVAPWLLGGADTLASMASVVAGLGLIALSLLDAAAWSPIVQSEVNDESLTDPVCPSVFRCCAGAIPRVRRSRHECRRRDRS